MLNHPLTTALYKECYMSSIRSKLIVLQSDLTMPQYKDQNEWSHFLSRVSLYKTWDKQMEQLFSEGENSILTCEPSN